MVSEKEYVRREVKEISFLIILGIVMTILLPLFLGLALGGFEESFVSGKPLEFGSFLATYMIYYIFIIGGLIGLPVLKVREMFVTKRGEHPANQSKPDPFSVAYLHDPETDGLLYNLFNKVGFKKNPMRFTLSIIRMFIISTLVFGSYGLLLTIKPQTQITGIPQISFQQVTPTMEVLFTAEPPAFSETILLLFLFSLLMGFCGWFTSKFKLGKITYFTLGFFVAILMGLIWMGFHNIAYGNSESGLFATFIFGFGGSFVTLLSGSFIPWYTWHFWNNVFAKLSQVVTSNEDIIFLSSLGLFLLLVLWITGEFALRKFRKKKQIYPQVPD